MPEENLGQSGGAQQPSGQDNAQSGAVPLKKPKTEAQKLREKERRKRRRQKKKAEELKNRENQEKEVDNVGEDVSFLNPQVDEAPMEAAPDLGVKEIKDPQGEEFSGLEMPKMMGGSHEGVDLTEEEAADFDHLDVPPPVPPVDESPEEIEETVVPEETPAVKEVYFQPQEDEEPKSAENDPAEAAIADENVEIEEPTTELNEVEVIEEPEIEETAEPVEDIRKLEVPASVQAFEDVDDISHEEAEKQREDENQQKVAELNEHLDSLEEIPVKQGLMGKMFDWFNDKFGKKDLENTEINEVLPVVEEETNFGGELVKKILGVVALIVLIMGAFWLGSSLKLFDAVMNLFKPGDVRLVLQSADPELQVVDLELLRGNGFRSAELFGENSGDNADTAYPSFKVAYYFGKLSEPVWVGETGITAALYYGFREEEAFLKNRFIFYVEELEKLYNTNTVNIDEYLSQSVRRDLALDKYLEDLQTAFDEGNALRKEIGLQVDELKIALNSTNPDKDRYEADFFNSLNTYQGEKADELLVAFIEVTQKQAEFKAKEAALSNLYGNYETILLSMKVRIEAISKNKGALVTGVKVRDIPNSGLDLVIE